MYRIVTCEPDDLAKLELELNRAAEEGYRFHKQLEHIPVRVVLLEKADDRLAHLAADFLEIVEKYFATRGIKKEPVRPPPSLELVPQREEPPEQAGGVRFELPPDRGDD